MDYYEMLAESILTNPDFKISRVSDLTIVKSLPSYHKYLSEIISILKNGSYGKLETIKDDSKSFDDITVIKFKGNNNLEFYGIVYDDWALETDPMVIKVIRIVPT